MGIVPTEDYKVFSNSYEVPDSLIAPAVVNFAVLLFLSLLAGILGVSYFEMRYSWKKNKVEKRRDKDIQRKLNQARELLAAERNPVLKILPHGRVCSIEDIYDGAMPIEFSDH